VQLKPGTRLQSAVCTTEVVVVKAPATDVELACGGAPMEPVGEPGTESPSPTEASEGTALGKRYADEALGLEVLCTKAGAGDLFCNGERLLPKSAKPLPSSD
jgi:hypothetical protein